MGLNYLAPSPYASFVTRNGAFQADANGLISNVGMGAQALDLLEDGCVPLAFNPFANFRNLIDGGDFSINPFQRNIPGIASGGVISTAIAATPTYFADRFFAAGFRSAGLGENLRAEVACDRQMHPGRDRARAEAAAGESRDGQDGRRECRCTASFT